MSALGPKNNSPRKERLSRHIRKITPRLDRGPIKPKSKVTGITPYYPTNEDETVIPK